MSYACQTAAVRVLDCLHEAERDLVGHTVQIFNGDVGDVRAVRLDDHHGLCFTLDDAVPLVPQRFYPVSTIRMKT